VLTTAVIMVASGLRGGGRESVRLRTLAGS